MISLALMTMTWSPMRTSFSRICAALCSVALETVVWHSSTGGSRLGDRRQHAVLADAQVDGRAMRRDGLLGVELVRRRPARGLGGDAEPLALSEAIDLDDHAIGVVVEVVPLLGPGLDVLDHAVDVVERLDMGVDREAVAAFAARRAPPCAF